MSRLTTPGPTARLRWECRATLRALIAAFAMVANAAAQESTGTPLGGALDPPAAVGALAPNLTAGTDAVWMTWLEPRADGRHAVCAARWHGDGWGDAHTVTEGADLFVNWADFPTIAIGADGELLAHWLQRSGPSTYAYDVRLARSRDAGETWTALGSPHHDGTETEHGFVSIVPDGSAFEVFWLDGREMGDGVARMTLRGARIGGDSTGSEVLDPDVCTCCQTGAARTKAGLVVVYRDHREGEVRDISIVRRTPSGWSTPTSIAADGWVIAGCPVNGPAVAARDDRVVVAWYTGAIPARVQVAFSRDGGTTFDTPIVVDGEGPIGRVDVALVGDRAIVGWLGAAEGGSELRMCAVADDGKVGDPLTIASLSAARSAGFPSLVATEGGILVAWRDTARRPRLRASLVPIDRL